jgi:hypothetical protein
MQTFTCETSLFSNIVNDLPPQNLYTPLSPVDVDLLMCT